MHCMVSVPGRCLSYRDIHQEIVVCIIGAKNVILKFTTMHCRAKDADVIFLFCFVLVMKTVVR